MLLRTKNFAVVGNCVASCMLSNNNVHWATDHKNRNSQCCCKIHVSLFHACTKQGFSSVKLLFVRDNLFMFMGLAFGHICTVPCISLITRMSVFVDFLLLTEKVCTKGAVWGVQPPPEIPKAHQNCAKTQPYLWKLLKIAEFRTPTPQDVWKKGSKILKLHRFAIVVH